VICRINRIPDVGKCFDSPRPGGRRSEQEIDNYHYFLMGSRRFPRWISQIPGTAKKMDVMGMI
jgi:hypothetical protein